MKKIIYVLIGVLIGLLFSLLLFQPRLDYFLDDESELIDNEMKIYDDDDDDDDDDANTDANLTLTLTGESTIEFSVKQNLCFICS